MRYYKKMVFSIYCLGFRGLLERALIELGEGVKSF